LCSATNDTRHARHDVILAMTLWPTALRSLDHGTGICIDAKWLGHRLQLVGCRQIDPAREAILLVVTTPRISFAEQFQRSIQGTRNQPARSVAAVAKSSVESQPDSTIG
jgi:hypothetical protein